MEDLFSGSPATDDDGSRNATKISDSAETLSAPKIDNDHIFSSNNSDHTEQVTKLHQQQNSLPLLHDPKPGSILSFDKPSQVDEAGDGSTPNQRKELPVELFASDFSAFTPAVPSWQLQPPHAMQYPPSPTETVDFMNAPKLSNPFDTGNERPQAQTTVLEPKGSVSMEIRSINSRIGRGVTIFLVFVLVISGVTPETMYSCWGGCYNQCFQDSKDRSENLSCIYKCFDGCIPRSAADFQSYCEVGCSLARCVPLSDDGAAMEDCFGQCASICKM